MTNLLMFNTHMRQLCRIAAAALFICSPLGADEKSDLIAARSVFDQNIAAIRQRDRDRYLSLYLHSDKLVRGGPAAVITTLGVLRFDAKTSEAYLASFHPFSTPDEVQAATGWPLCLAPDCSPTPPPTAEELRLIREADPHGFWTR